MKEDNNKIVFLERQVDSLTKLVGINNIITSTLDIGSLLTIIMEKIKDIMETEASTLLLYDEISKELVFKVALGSAGKKLQEKYRIEIGQGIAGWVARKKESIYINDVYSDDRFDPKFDKLTGYTTVAILCAPLIFQGKMLGVIEAINPLSGAGFNQDHLELFNAFSNQAAIAIENASLYTHLENKVEERTAELADAYKKLKELDSAKTNFFTNISHELRTPLTLILSPTESVLKGDYGETLSYNDDIFKSIHKNSIQLLNLINNLLDFSKIEAGAMTLKNQKSDISSLLKHYKSSVTSAAKSKNLEISFIDKTEGVIAWIDQNLLEKSIFNLISNALKFTPAGGTITVTLEQENDYFTISVRDTGIGIEDDMREIIFGRFSQVDSSLSRKYSGTGIGLSLSKEIVELHKGNIDVTSKLGEGSTFTMRIPINRPAKTEDNEKTITKNQDYEIEEVNPYLWQNTDKNNNTPESLPKPKSAHMNQILIVDDNIEMLNFLDKLLSRDYSIIRASNGQEALSILLSSKKHPDLIIADIMMPLIDGYELTQSIRSDARFEGLPIILLTAKADISKKVEGIQKGANDYIVKPFNPRELLARVKSQIELKSLRDKLVESNKRLTQIMNDSSILVSDIGHKFHNELWPFAQMIMLGKTLVERIEDAKLSLIEKEELTFAKENLAKCEQSLERIEMMKEKIKRNFGKQTEKSYNKLGYLIEDILQSYDPVFNENNIILKKDLELSFSKEIKVNAEQIKIALENILNNAIQALLSSKMTKKEKMITIRAFHEKNNFHIQIEDNGIGIPQEVCDNIFSMFFTLKKKEARKGLGLGLHITRWIIQDCHKGNIKVESEEGKYTRFIIILPEDGDLV